MHLIFNEQKPTMATTTRDDLDITCPRCGRKACIRIKRSIIVKSLFSWLLLKRFHCQNCLRNFYKM